MQVYCVTDKSLNLSIGGGTEYINLIDEQWYQAFLNVLKSEAAGAVAKLEACVIK